MNNRHFLLSAAFIAVVSAVAAGAGAAGPSYHGSSLAKFAKVDIASARATALKARPGKITDEELEREKGGSGLRYSFDISDKGRAYEVGVDAQSGAVLENKAEGKNPD